MLDAWKQKNKYLFSFVKSTLCSYLEDNPRVTFHSSALYALRVRNRVSSTGPPIVKW